ncbi:hypothetical protein FHS61_002452 [Altererythrobacter atlanticus]|uniref:Uncharacterized protein n=1 Tax=Croceibacterium atlanticum TaxID=1267766 RepID=A0A0F7KT98_9SPHN|nr:hypothetical protein [Croceibacterium atlanticum]AKH42015.1 hypothetical protein WYH_00967 [Croceibacterium atlanticum]MBB5733417.1 hypothetical protein [Croceibacterium atlanticum]
MASFIEAQRGWNLHYLDRKTGLPFDGDYRPDPIIAWKISENPETVSEPVIVGQLAEYDYVCISPEGHVIHPQIAVFTDISAFRRYILRKRETAGNGE